MEAKRTSAPRTTIAQPEVLTLLIAFPRVMFISSRRDLVNGTIVCRSTRNGSSVKGVVGGYEQARIGSLSVGTAGKAVQQGQRSRRSDAEESAQVKGATIERDPI